MANITEVFSSATQRRVASCLISVACLCLLWASWKALVETQFVLNSTKVSGSVVAVTKDGKRPTIEFQSVDGAPRRFFEGSSSGFHDYRVGQRVQVRYLQMASLEVKLDAVLYLWEMTFVFSYLGIICLTLGMLIRTGKLVVGPLRQRRFLVGSE